MPLTPLASSYDHLLLDLDGCLWVGDEPTERATDALAALRVAGKGIAFVTNDGRHSAEEQVRKLWRLGFQASAEEVVTVGGALQFHLAERYGHDRAAAVVVGSRSLHRHVEQAGLRIVNDTAFASRAEVVVVGRARRLRLRGAARGRPGRDEGRDGGGGGARPLLPHARRARGPAAEPSSRRWRRPRGWSRRTSASRRRRSSTPRSTGSGRAGRSSSATAWTPTWRPRRTPGSTGRSCSPARRAALQGHSAEGAVVVRESLADLVLI